MYRRLVFIAAPLLLLLSLAVGAWAHSPGNDPFERTWARTDKPVADVVVSRTWIWGPQANTPLLNEDYAQSPGGKRVVQYFDKNRMEITQPGAVDDGLWYVTNGLLVVEMVEGYYQTGDTERDESPQPAEVSIAGDPGQHPTYADIFRFDLRNQPAREVDTLIDGWFDESGITVLAPDALPYEVYAEHYVVVDGIDHTIAAPFWDFMNSEGIVYEASALTVSNVFQNPFYATGYPITEAYWSDLHVGGTTQPVLWQCFERRCLTYSVANDNGWQVEAGNVGQHYYQWRYGTLPLLVFNATGHDPFESDLYVVDAQGGALRQLTTGSDIDHLPAWSPAGKRVAFIRQYTDAFDRDIFVVDADGTGLTNLTQHAAYYDVPTWSPDSSQIAFVRSVDESPYSSSSESLFVVNADGSNLRRLTDPPLTVLAFRPSWSPDGTRIAVSGNRLDDSDTGGIYLVNADGTGTTLLTNGLSPSWSPDGTRIAFLSDFGSDNGGTRLSVINADGTGLTQLERLHTNTHPPSWSPDSQQITVFHAPQGYGQIYVVNADGSGIRAITDSGGSRNDLIPVWSPDGARIAFYAFGEDNQSDVWVVHPDGSGLTAVSGDLRGGANPSWQVSGR
jgi:Tol biopolymer transport system component